MNVIDITSELQTANSKIRLAAYCRVSSDSADQLHSFASQIRYYKDYERKNPRYQLVDIYADEGITGTSMVKRDEFNRMIRDCKKGKIDRIIVKSVSRFARNTQELLTAVRMLKEIGVSVCFEEQGIDTDKLNIEMILTFPGMAAQQESESISGNMRWSYHKRMESGEFNTCKPPYGYDSESCKLIIPIGDDDLIAAVTAQLKKLSQHPDRIQANTADPVSTPEIQSLDRSIRKALNGVVGDKESIRKKILNCVSLKYQQISDSQIVSRRLMSALRNESFLGEGYTELIRKTVKQIRLHTDGSVCLTLINDQRLEREGD